MPKKEKISVADRVNSILESGANSEIVPVIETPIDVLNIVGAGGIREGTTVEFYGEPKSGKSTACYQIGAKFISNYKRKGKKALVWIIDAENSVDDVRLQHVFKIPKENYIVKHTDSIEDSFYSVREACMYAKETGTKVLIVYDSLGVQTSKLAVDKSKEALDEKRDTRIESGGMALKPRVVKNQLQLIAGDLVDTKTTLFIINQISVDFSGWLPKQVSTGGFALKHNCHYSIRFKKAGEITDENGVPIKIKTFLSLEKTKFTPQIGIMGKVDDGTKTAHGMIELLISTSLGGLIVPGRDVVMHAIDLGIIEDVGRKRYICKDPDAPEIIRGASEDPKTGEVVYKKFTIGTILKDPQKDPKNLGMEMPPAEVRNYCIRKVTEHYRRTSLTVDANYRVRGISLGEVKDSAQNKFDGFVSTIAGDDTSDLYSNSEDTKEVKMSSIPNENLNGNGSVPDDDEGDDDNNKDQTENPVPSTPTENPSKEVFTENNKS